MKTKARRQLNGVSVLIMMGFDVGDDDDNGDYYDDDDSKPDKAA